MNPKLQTKIEKIKALIRGGVDGESAAAQEALNRIIEKYELNPKEVLSPERRFKYSTIMEDWLIQQINLCFFGGKYEFWKDTYGVKELLIKEMEYTDYVAMDCAYEYFRRHMKAQWNKTCLPLLSRKRKAKTRNKLRKQLQNSFFIKYIFESNLYEENQLIEVDTSKLSKSELSSRAAVRNVEGGQYNKQMTTGLYLEQ